MPLFKKGAIAASGSFRLIMIKTHMSGSNFGSRSRLWLFFLVTTLSGSYFAEAPETQVLVFVIQSRIYMAVFEYHGGDIWNNKW